MEKAEGVEETKNLEPDQQSANNNSPLTLIHPDWTMFKKEAALGEGAYGTVFKVKSLLTSYLS